jgi:hypothetical protein
MRGSATTKAARKIGGVAVIFSLAGALSACSSSSGKPGDAAVVDVPGAVGGSGAGGARSGAGGAAAGACMNGTPAPALATPLAGPSNDAVTVLPGGLPMLNMVPNILLTPVLDAASNIYMAANTDPVPGVKTTLNFVKLKPNLRTVRIRRIFS